MIIVSDGLVYVCAVSFLCFHFFQRNDLLTALLVLYSLLERLCVDECMFMFMQKSAIGLLTMALVFFGILQERVRAIELSVI